MPLEALRTLDRRTSNTILAAAALATTANPEIDDTFGLIQKYQNEVNAVLKEIRQKLKLREDDRSSKANAFIDDFLVKALDDSVLAGSDAEAALKRVAQAGRLSPGAYKVIQPEAFRNRFYSLSVTKKQVDDTVRDPDDFQHLMTERATQGEEDIFSLFMKRFDGTRKAREPNWLLVQSLRRGLEQVAQSAWRIFPLDVDLSKAEKPLDVLAAFAEKFGFEVQVGDRKGKLIDVASLPKTGDQMKYDVHIALPPDAETFFSISHLQTTDIFSFDVGLFYCIDIRAYRQYLIAHGASVH